MNRLETIAPNLSKILREADSKKLATLKFAACKRVIPLLKGQPGDIISQATAELLANGKLPKATRNDLELIADSLDEKYLPLYEDDPNNKDAYMTFFTQARAVSAISSAGEDDPYESAVESIYEAAQAVDDKKSFLEYLETLV